MLAEIRGPQSFDPRGITLFSEEQVSNDIYLIEINYHENAEVFSAD